MQAAILEEVGGPLVVTDLKDPVPGRNEVLIDVVACGVCHTDLHVMKGEVAFPSPCVLGHEVSGFVRAVGGGVDTVREGDRVVASFIIPCGICRHCVRGHDDLCEIFFEYNRLRGVYYDGKSRLFTPSGVPVAMYSMGALAEQCVVPAENVFALPSGVDLARAAVLGCSVFTGYGAVRNGADLQFGESVAVVAVGGVGLSIIQVARAFGAPKIVAVDISPEKLEVARSLGATHTIDASQEDAAESIRSVTAGRGVDVAFEALGNPVTVDTAIRSVDDGGRVVLVGIAPAGVSATFDITRIVRRKIQIRGSYGGRPRTDMQEVLRMAAEGYIDLERLVSGEYGLDEADRAYRDLDAGRIRGRSIVRVRP